jgi:glutaminase
VCDHVHVLSKLPCQHALRSLVFECVCVCVFPSHLHPQSVAFEQLVDLIGQLAGGRPVGFDDAVFESERTTGVRNYDIADKMIPENIFPADANVDEALLFYFSQCAIQLDIQSLAHVAATCANRGVCPSTGRVVARPDTVVAMLRLMYFW